MWGLSIIFPTHSHLIQKQAKPTQLEVEKKWIGKLSGLVGQDGAKLRSSSQMFLSHWSDSVWSGA